MVLLHRNGERDVLKFEGGKHGGKISPNCRKDFREKLEGNISTKFLRRQAFLCCFNRREKETRTKSERKIRGDGDKGWYQLIENPNTPNFQLIENVFEVWFFIEIKVEIQRVLTWRWKCIHKWKCIDLWKTKYTTFGRNKYHWLTGKKKNILYVYQYRYWYYICTIL